MKKNVKVLSGALAASLTMGAMPVFAADMSADELYKAAFEAVLAAQEARTQESINTARTAIKALAGTDAEFAVGEFSKQVDGVQQELFEGFLAALDKAQKSNKQADINAARTYVEMFRTCPDTLVYVEGGWSQEVDLVQQKLIDKAEAAVRKAEKTRLQADVDAAKALLVELATSTNKDVTAWVTAIETELEAVKVKELTVKQVSLITKQSVTVTFDALKEAIEGVNVVVRDGKGNLVEVNSVAVLDVGETTATFMFKTALSTEPSGKWTVDGIEFDADAQAAVNAVKNAKNQVELLNALQSSYFKGVNPSLITQYEGKFADVNIVADIQKIIDTVNAQNITAEQVKAVNDAKNQVELLKALKDGGFARVNAELIADYASYNSENYKTAADAVEVQNIIDKVNLTAAQNAVTAADTTVATALKTDSISKAQVLVSILPEKEEADKTTKKELQNRIDKANAYVKVKAATTQASLLSALKAPVLKLQNIDDALAKYYKLVFDTDKDNITSVAYILQTSIVDAGKTKAIEDYVTKIDAVTTETTLTNVKALLTELKRLDGSVFTEKINDSLLEDYKAAIIAGSISNTASINTIVQTVNTNTIELQAVKDYAGTNADELLNLLKNKKLALSNVVDANKDAYLADLVLVKAEAAKTVADLQKAINTINFVANANKATTAAQMQTAITGISVNQSIEAYIKLSSAAKTEVAELVLASKNTGFDNLEAVKNAISTKTTAYSDFLGNVNAATDINDMMTKLNDEAFPSFQKLDVVEKVMKAELVFNKLQELKGLAKPSEFKTIAEIKAAAGL